MLVEGLAETAWPLLWLDDLRLDAPYTEAMRSGFARAAMPTSILEGYHVAQLAIVGGWEEFARDFPKVMKKNLRQAVRRALDFGKLSFKVHTSFTAAEVEPLLHRGFLVEDNSWKGRRDTSVLSAGMYPFFLRQAQQLYQALVRPPL